jgi:predicted flap endonuclease-1-like 5' DNA nuclease
MHYLALQITVFLLIAILSGIAIGWWAKGLFIKVLLEDHKSQSSSTQRNFLDIREQLRVLQVKHKQAQQQIEKYSAHYNNNTYGQYLEARKELELTRKRNEELLTENHKKDSLINKLEHKQAQNNISDSTQSYAVKSTANSIHTEIHVEDDYYSDDLKKIRGITSQVEGQLNSLGILKYRQIAEFSLQDAEMISQHLESHALPDYSFMVATARDLHISKQSHQAA